MAATLTAELEELLEDPRPLHTGVIVDFELPGGGYHRITNYFKDLVVDGNVYSSGPLKSIGDIKQTASFSTYNLQVQVSGADSVEMQRALNSGAYMGRKIKVQRIYCNHNGTVVPATASSTGLPMFEGVITRAGIADTAGSSGESTSIITWTCSSKFADFQVTNGRSTNDEEHRGLILGSDGVTLTPSSAAKKEEYKTDKGFQHATNTVAILANYQITETKYKISTTKGGYLWG